MFALLLVAVTGCGISDGDSAESAGDELRQRLARNGIAVAIPSGWDGRILFREATGRDGVLLQVANFTLPSNEGLEPPEELPPGEEDPIKAMDDGDVVVMISEPASWDAARAGAAARTPMTLADLAPVLGPRVPSGHSFAQGTFCFASRCLLIEVDFGAGQPRDDLVSRVDEVLASLAVGER
jgi:hypothetical protein